ncbi:hypothetical protein LSH36_772g01036 [Paralvinella palmiformis]|uniref:Uncharacterized protein n=1 Tax=Paralvinella palmiformis TaxID=53620 RepID=A0AAD9J0V7_9ANNE|nr:hypothetical protein LSH36_772g01036 [Paralvinella palmiformis]
MRPVLPFRLESYDRNDNFGHQLVQAEQFNMIVPEESRYKDINSETQMPTVTEEQVKIYMDLYGQDLKAITHGKQESIEIKTRGQGTNKFWREECLLRLHASKFGRICTATDRTDFPKLAESLTQYKNIKLSAIIHGRKYEAVACDAYSKDQSVSVNE